MVGSHLMSKKRNDMVHKAPPRPDRQSANAPTFAVNVIFSLVFNLLIKDIDRQISQKDMICG
jgi:hypothetical protein